MIASTCIILPVGLGLFAALCALRIESNVVSHREDNLFSSSKSFGASEKDRFACIKSSSRITNTITIIILIMLHDNNLSSL